MRQAALYRDRSILCRFRGRLDEALAHADQAERLFLAAGDRLGPQTLLPARLRVLALKGETDEALALLDRWTRSTDRQRADVLAPISAAASFVRYGVGDLGGARSAIEAAWEAAETAREYTGTYLAMRGLLDGHAGEVDRGRARLLAAISEQETLGCAVGHAEALVLWAVFEAQHGERSTAQRSLARASARIEQLDVEPTAEVVWWLQRAHQAAR